MVEPTEEQRFAEEMGRAFEEWNLPRMAGRVWGVTIVTDDGAVSAQDLADRLHASAGSISTATRFLLQNGLIERVRVPGERREYFRFNPESRRAIFQQRIDAVSAMHRMFEGAMARFEDRPAAHERLNELHDFYEWMESELDELMRRWKRSLSTESGA